MSKISSVEKTLNARKEIHGAWVVNSALSQKLKELLSKNKENRSPSINEGLDAICGKLARIVSGDAFEPDHWHDIQGYAKLVENELQVPIGSTKTSHEANCPVNTGSDVSACTCKA